MVSISTESTRIGNPPLPWTRHDTMWMLGLFGTAIGAGTLFLPINAGLGGFWPLAVMAVIAFPMTYLAHRGLCRFILSSSKPGSDITEVVTEHFGSTAGKLITLLYFFTILPILLIYGVGLTNTVQSFLVHQLGMVPPPRILLSLGLILGLMGVIKLGEQMVVRVMSWLVYPFVVVLMGIGLYLAPDWNGAILDQVPTAGQFSLTLWLSIPALVFSFNHSPAISRFVVAQQNHYGEEAESQTTRIEKYAVVMMVLVVLFFVFSCVFSLSPQELADAKAQNISILSYLGNKFDNPLMALLTPAVAFVAITKSFFGHYLGAREGLNGLISQHLRGQGKPVDDKAINRFSALFMVATVWIAATLNPSILGMIESLCGPIIAALLFIMPMYAIRKVPAMRRYAGQPGNVVVIFIGSVAISAILYSLLSL
ncbi:MULTISPECIES: serine/threonine transporter [Azospirillum]|uniref:HAAAP family serine/threonine permease n=1 Tax=Azospirillum lipoferum TaxID=193 RepID=A0A5A9G6V9_AZOLI|nr:MULTISPECIES: serine/threonine transporter [Azospirillum]KAA0590258.1 HAAAP family serine/threonine permease [Azospirillum lipoferum]MDW5532467.1 serine/threonine transporter [Azospirillum sp. NL1]